MVAVPIGFVVKLRALAVRLVQLWAICPVPPQNMQSLLSKRLCLSSTVSFPQFSLQLQATGCRQGL
jgi:hypothetical protein